MRLLRQAPEFPGKFFKSSGEDLRRWGSSLTPQGMPRIHTHTLRVYYEDTDMAGIVYYANYLKFIERGRSDWVRDIGMDQNQMRDQHGIVFAVRRVEADYLAPARLDDVLEVQTWLSETRGARFSMEQRVSRGETLLFQAKVDIVVMTLAGRPTRLPPEIGALLKD